MAHPLETIRLRSLSELTDSLSRLIQGRLWVKVLVAMAAGVALGLVLGPSVGLVPQQVSAPLVAWLALPGTLFLALIQMIVVPLVFASVVRGLTASENVGQLRSVGLGAAVFFLLTTAASTALGLALALLVKPGRFIDPASLEAALATPAAANVTPAEPPGLTDLPEALVGLLPSNPLASMVGGDMLQVILFAVVFGVALVNLSTEKSAPLFDLLGSVQEVCMKVVAGAMRLAPLAVFGLMSRLTASVGLDVLRGMAVYVATVLLGLTILLAFLVLLASIGSRRGAGAFLAAVREVGLLAFSTSSSAAVMPLTIQTAEEKLGVRPAVARLLVPLGATVNMNGTALYQGVATVFLAQVFDVPLGVPGLLFVVVTAVAASVGSPATPGMGIVILAMVLEGAGIPVAGVALLMGVDRLLDMCRTAVNVTGDLTACVVLDRWSGDDPIDPVPVADLTTAA
ncbi:MAG: dicarboxylate/amino acid:cation symporter [Myxococcota bacterium]